MSKLYGIWTSISGGVTGSRSAWLKRSGEVLTFATQAEAEAEAARLTVTCTLKGGVSPSGRPIAYQYFRACGRDEQ
jgi:hypothetical protein